MERLISEIPDIEEIPTERELQIEKAIEEIQVTHNLRDEANQSFQIKDEVRIQEHITGAKFDAMVNVTTDPRYINLDNNAMLVTLLIKRREIRRRIYIMGDIDINSLNNLQVTIPEGMRAGESASTMTQQTTMTDDPETAISTISTSQPMEMAAEEVQQSPEEEDVSASKFNTPGELSNADVVQPIPGTSGIRARPRKRKTYKEPSSTSFESLEDTTNSEEVTQRKKGREHSIKRKRGASTKIKSPKKRAKDGRKLIDLTDRERGPGGRFGGYKPGTSSKSTRPRCKSSTPAKKMDEPMASSTPAVRLNRIKMPNRPLIKLPTVIPPTTTEVKKKLTTMSNAVQKISLENPVIQDSSRARSMRPMSVPASQSPGLLEQAVR